MTARRIFTLLSAAMAAAAACVLSGCGAKSTGQAEVESVRTAMGIDVRIRVIGPDEATCSRAGDAAFARIAQLDAMLTDYDPASEVSRISAAAGGPPQPASAETFDVTRQALEWWKTSGGAFDPTIRPVILLWRQAAANGQLPTEYQLADARQLVGGDKVELDADAHTIRLQRAGMSLDLGGIAKGYIVDQAVDRLRANGIGSGIIDAGGDVYALGAKADGAPWRVAVKIPPPAQAEYELVLSLKDRAVATSGDYRRGFDIGGKHYSHIIDPRTAWPVDAVPSATVVATDLTTADALATAVSVLGPEHGIKLINTLPDTEALILSREGAMLRAVTSTGFADYILEGNDWLTELK